MQSMLVLAIIGSMLSVSACAAPFNFQFFFNKYNPLFNLCYVHIQKKSAFLKRSVVILGL